MTHTVDANTLHRTAKYFMDSGHVESHEDAMELLNKFGLTIYVGPEIAFSPHPRNAFLTIVNLASRTFLGGVEVVGLPDAQSLSPLAPKRSLTQAVSELNGRLVAEAVHSWPSALVGTVASWSSR